MANKTNLVECRAVIDFLDTYSSSGTINSYKTYLNNYFKWLNIKPNEYIKSKRDFSNDVVEYAKFRSNKGAPLSRKQELVAVKQFLEHNDIDIKQRIWKNIRKRNKVKTPSTKDKILKNSEIKQILLHTDIKGKAIILLLCTSGLRIKELTEISWDDIDLNNNEVYISSDLAKNGIDRYTFFTDEAKDALLEWKKALPVYSKRAKARTEKCLGKEKPNADGKVFPYSTATIGIMWNGRLKILKKRSQKI